MIQLINRHRLIAFAVIFLISRILFINTGPVFFDSLEYISRLENPDLLGALTSGHLPLHPGYVLLFWPIFGLAKTLGLNPPLFIILFQIMLAVTGVISTYFFIIHLLNEKTARVALALVTFMPLYWVTNETINMESVYVPLFFVSVYFLVFYLKKKSTHNRILALSALLFGLSFLTHMMIILWIPFISSLVLFFNKKRFLTFFIFFSMSLFFFSLINGYLISISESTSLGVGIIRLYTSKLQEHAVFSFNLQSFGIILRNISIPSFANFTVLICILSVLGLVKVFHNNKKKLFIMLLWAGPIAITNQWWDSLLFGRHSLIASFGIATLAAYFIHDKLKATILTVIYLAAVSIPTLSLLKENIPYIELSKNVSILPKNGLYIESHFARPQIDKKYAGETVFIDEPGWDKNSLEQKIKKYLLEKRPVFISSQALSEPYGLYSGPYLHVLSLSYRRDHILKPVITHFTLKKEKMISERDNLIIFRVISDKPSLYPKILNLKYSRRRIDFSDPIMRFWFAWQR